jgi:hypothetical protein
MTVPGAIDVIRRLSRRPDADGSYHCVGGWRRRGEGLPLLGPGGSEIS